MVTEVMAQLFDHGIAFLMRDKLSLQIMELLLASAKQNFLVYVFHGLIEAQYRHRVNTEHQDNGGDTDIIVIRLSFIKGNRNQKDESEKNGKAASHNGEVDPSLVQIFYVLPVWLAEISIRDA